MNNLIIEALRRIEALEIKLEKYFEILSKRNELDLFWTGTYLTDEDFDLLWNGTLEVSE